MSRRPDGELRKGWTTGACAAAAARAAFEALHTGHFTESVSIRLPRGQRPSFAVAARALHPGRATAGIVKDAGDDPDVTNGALILAQVEPAPAGSGVTFRAGEGVGTVTRPGLALAVGEPAINPGPRAMIAQAIADAADGLGIAADALVTIAVPGGAALAEKTLNARLGIVGGLSILGTTGVVVPYSCASWIHSIHRGVDVARAAGLRHLAGATGSVSEAAVRTLHGLDDAALIDMGDFVGALLKYLRRHPVDRLTVAGGFAKLVKLAQGHLDLHSARSQVDLAALAALALSLGADDAVRRAGSAAELLQASGDVAPALAARIAAQARAVVLATLSGGIAVDVAVFDRGGALLGHADA